MASPITWAQGLAGSGIDTATASPVIVSANVIWLDFTNGNDGNAGTQPELPVKTFAQAVTNAASNSIIAVVAGNAEIITGTVAINKSVRVVSFGIGSGAAAFQPTSASTLMFNITADDVSFDGVRFKDAVGTPGNTGWVSTANKGTEFYSCTFEFGGSMGVGVIFAAGADYFRIDGSVFSRTGSGGSASPVAVNCTGTNIAGKIINTVFDGSTFGWGSSNAVVVTNCTRLYMKNIILVGRTDIFGSTTVSYQIVGVITSGASRIQLT